MSRDLSLYSPPVHARRFQRGAVLGITAVFVFLVCLLVLGIASLSLTSSRVAEAAHQKAQATALAEAGVQSLYAQVATYLSTSSSYAAYTGPSAVPASGPDPSLSSTFNSTTATDGSYSASLVNPTPTPVVVYTYDSHGNANGGTATYTFQAKGIGTAPNGVKSQIYASWTVKGSSTPASTGGAPFTFPNGAMVSNGNIVLQGSSLTTDSAGGHNAGGMANGVISNKGNSYSVDGPLSAAPSSFSASQSALGSSPNDYTHSVTALSAPIVFPTSATVSSWTSTWVSEAKETWSAFPSGHIIGSTYNVSGNTTLTAPAYINGDLTISGGTLTITPDTTAPAPTPAYVGAPPLYVVYVHGNINFSTGNSNLINNGVMLVCDGTFSCGKNSSYQVGTYPSNTPYKDSAGRSLKGQMMYQTSGLISLSPSANAITIGGNGSANIGLAYAINGGATISGNGTYTGSLISGKAGSGGGIVLQAGSLIYPLNLNSAFTGLPAPNQSSTMQSYSANPLGQWVQTL